MEVGSPCSLMMVPRLGTGPSMIRQEGNRDYPSLQTTNDSGSRTWSSSQSLVVAATSVPAISVVPFSVYTMTFLPSSWSFSPSRDFSEESFPFFLLENGGNAYARTNDCRIRWSSCQEQAACSADRGRREGTGKRSSSSSCVTRKSPRSLSRHRR